MATFKQKALRFLYPFTRIAAKIGKNGTVLNNESKTAPTVPFYEQKATLNNGKKKKKKKKKKKFFFFPFFGKKKF